MSRIFASSMSNREKYKYNSVVFAKYLIACANKRCIQINMTKLQKFLYIAYGLYLAVKDIRLLNEYPKAWPYGPVFPTTRNRLIKEDFTSIDIDDSAFDELKGDEEVKSLIELVFDSFGDYSASMLSEWSHKEESPWGDSVSRQGFKWGDVMDDDSIQNYFKKITKKKDGAPV